MFNKARPNYHDMAKFVDFYHQLKPSTHDAIKACFQRLETSEAVWHLSIEEGCRFAFMTECRVVDPDIKQADDPESVFATLVVDANCESYMAELLASLYIVKNGLNPQNFLE